jgi:hypothetical protein
VKKKKDNPLSEIGKEGALLLPNPLIRHPNMAMLSPYGVKLLIDLGTQYTGFNNGYLCASWSLMKKRGWRSSCTLYKAVLECEYYGLLVRTRSGGMNTSNLHAFTWRKINEKADKPLALSPTSAPSDAWKEPRERYVYQKPARSRSFRSRGRKGRHEKRVA